MTDLATGALAPLHNRDFRFLLAGFAIGQMLMPLQFITQILWVQSTAPSNVWLILVAFIATSVLSLIVVPTMDAPKEM